MDFKIGYNVKPKEVNNVNEVIFEEYAGVGIFRDVTPTADDCKAYGFVFKSSTSKCYALSNPLIFKASTTSNLSISRATNFIGRNTRDNIISGTSHLLYSNNYSNIISGDNNSVNDLVCNTKISGVKAIATASNSTVLGGNNSTDALGKRQSIHLMYGKQTTAGSTVASWLNNVSANYFQIPDNTAMYFHADILAVRVGGTGTGNIGDYASWVERGVIINKSGVLSISRERDVIKSSGTTSAWRPTAAVSGTSFVMNVRGATDVTVEWASDIKFTQIKTGVAL
tara:strand:- start:18 stop:866 length:849 start_codon:yes stop_codon:yes gene_type:complete